MELEYSIIDELDRVSDDEQHGAQVASCCEKWRHNINVPGKDDKKYPLRCNRWRECDNCFRVRADQIKKGIEHRLETDSLYMIELRESKRDIDNLIRRNDLKIADMGRFPIGTDENEGNVEVLFVLYSLAQDLELTGGKRIRLCDADTLDYSKLAKTSEGRNRSGGLVRYVKILHAIESEAPLTVDDFHAEDSEGKEVEYKIIETAIKNIFAENTYSVEVPEDAQKIYDSVFAQLTSQMNARGFSVVIDRTYPIIVDFSILQKVYNIENPTSLLPLDTLGVAAKPEQWRLFTLD